MEVLRPGELLADQGRAHDPALALDQAAIGRMGNSACATPVVSKG
jgi:hypothetical protein